MVVRWGDLTRSEQNSFGNGCGGNPSAIVDVFRQSGLKSAAWLTMRLFSLVPQFKFEFSCRQHDFYYARGGGLFDKTRADFMALACWISDAWKRKYFYGIGNVFYTCAGMLYFVLISTVGIFFFKWGKQKTKNEIL